MRFEGLFVLLSLVFSLTVGLPSNGTTVEYAEVHYSTMNKSEGLN